LPVHKNVSSCDLGNGEAPGQRCVSPKRTRCWELPERGTLRPLHPVDDAGSLGIGRAGAPYGDARVCGELGEGVHGRRIRSPGRRRGQHRGRRGHRECG
jgi:hypothetical protein